MRDHCGIHDIAMIRHASSITLLDMDPLEKYLSERYWSEDELLREVRADTARRGPSIQVSAEAGRLLALFVRALGATRVLEVGTLFGYSGIWMARNCTPTLLSTGSRAPDSVIGLSSIAERAWT